MLGQRFRCDFSLGEALGMIVLWLVLTIVTLGLAAFVLPYYFLKAPMNRTYILDREGNVISRVSVEFGFGDILGHALIWLVLSVITFGLAYLVFWAAVIRKLLNAVELKAI